MRGRRPRATRLTRAAWRARAMTNDALQGFLDQSARVGPRRVAEHSCRCQVTPERRGGVVVATRRTPRPHGADPRGDAKLAWLGGRAGWLGAGRRRHPLGDAAAEGPRLARWRPLLPACAACEPRTPRGPGRRPPFIADPYAKALAGVSQHLSSQARHPAPGGGLAPGGCCQTLRVAAGASLMFGAGHGLRWWHRSVAPGPASACGRSMRRRLSALRRRQKSPPMLRDLEERWRPARRRAPETQCCAGAHAGAGRIAAAGIAYAPTPAALARTSPTGGAGALR